MRQTTRTFTRVLAVLLAIAAALAGHTTAWAQGITRASSGTFDLGKTRTGTFYSYNGSSMYNLAL